jgi:hypothetical protein
MGVPQRAHLQAPGRVLLATQTREYAHLRGGAGMMITRTARFHVYSVIKDQKFGLVRYLASCLIPFS